MHYLTCVLCNYRTFRFNQSYFLTHASYGHFGRDSFEEEVEVYYKDENVIKKMLMEKKNTSKK